MRKLSLLFLLLFSSISSFSQVNIPCGTDIILNRMMERDSNLKARRALLDNTAKNKSQTITDTTYIIPIVFHILHQNGPENISDSQVLDALEILNNDYNKNNPDISNVIPSFQSIADSTRIHFKLPSIDPSGNCTNGIIHHFDVNTDWDATIYPYYFTWDPTKYLNVYLVRSIDMGNGFGAAGYTYLPGTFSDGDPSDAIVVLNNYFGSIGTGNSFLSRVLTHEIGHWLNLSHVFGGTNSAGVDCSGDDFVDDTPVTPGYLYCPNASNNFEFQQCSPGIDENYQNFMDYSYCCLMFTGGQGQRMRNALESTISGRNNLWSQTNLNETGVNNNQNICIPIAGITANRTLSCVGVPISFSDNSSNGQASIFNWSFPGGNPSTSVSSNPIVTYSSPGTYSVSYTCGNIAGTSDPISYSDYITIVDNSVSEYSNIWSEDFESTTIPGNDWRTQNTSGGVQWQLSSDAAFSGFTSAKLSRINNLRLNRSELIGPTVNLSSINSPVLTFKLAAAEVNINHVNTLKVFASSNCEQSWQEIYSSTGQNLISSASQDPEFIPLNSSDWRMETIDLSSLANESVVNFKFVYYRDTLPFPNNIYIDDINVSSPNTIANDDGETKWEVFPNPSNGKINIKLSPNLNSTISLFDCLGNIIETKFSAKNQTSYFEFNSEEKLSTGVYFLKLFNSECSKVIKVLIK